MDARSRKLPLLQNFHLFDCCGYKACPERAQTTFSQRRPFAPHFTCKEHRLLLLLLQQVTILNANAHPLLSRASLPERRTKQKNLSMTWTNWRPRTRPPPTPRQFQQQPGGIWEFFLLLQHMVHIVLQQKKDIKEKLTDDLHIIFFFPHLKATTVMIPTAISILVQSHVP